MPGVSDEAKKTELEALIVDVLKRYFFQVAVRFSLDQLPDFDGRERAKYLTGLTALFRDARSVLGPEQVEALLSGQTVQTAFPCPRLRSADDARWEALIKEAFEKSKGGTVALLSGSFRAFQQGCNKYRQNSSFLSRGANFDLYWDREMRALLSRRYEGSPEQPEQPEQGVSRCIDFLLQFWGGEDNAEGVAMQGTRPVSSSSSWWERVRVPERVPPVLRALKSIVAEGSELCSCFDRALSRYDGVLVSVETLLGMRVDHEESLEQRRHRIEKVLQHCDGAKLSCMQFLMAKARKDLARAMGDRRAVEYTWSGAGISSPLITLIGEKQYGDGGYHQGNHSCNKDWFQLRAVDERSSLFVYPCRDTEHADRLSDKELTAVCEGESSVKLRKIAELYIAYYKSCHYHRGAAHNALVFMYALFRLAFPGQEPVPFREGVMPDLELCLRAETEQAFEDAFISGRYFCPCPAVFGAAQAQIISEDQGQAMAASATGGAGGASGGGAGGGSYDGTTCLVRRTRQSLDLYGGGDQAEFWQKTRITIEWVAQMLRRPKEDLQQEVCNAVAMTDHVFDYLGISLDRENPYSRETIQRCLDAINNKPDKNGYDWLIRHKLKPLVDESPLTDKNGIEFSPDEKYIGRCIDHLNKLANEETAPLPLNSYWEDFDDDELIKLVLDDDFSLDNLDNDCVRELKIRISTMKYLSEACSIAEGQTVQKAEAAKVAVVSPSVRRSSGLQEENKPG